MDPPVWFNFSQEFSVLCCHSSRFMNFNHILVIAITLHNFSSYVPSRRVVSHLILYLHGIMKGNNSLVFCDSLSMFLKALFRSAFSLSSRRSPHFGHTFNLWIGAGRKSRRFLPKITCAGDLPVSRSGVFRYDITTLKNLSLLRLPEGPVFSRISCFIHNFSGTSVFHTLCMCFLRQYS